MEPKLRILSLGAGVQSTTLALMAARRDIGPMPDAAIFADTGWEPEHVYRHLEWLEKLLPFPVHRVTAGNIRDGLIGGSKGNRWASIPAFTDTGPIRRQCTKEYKIVPIRRKVRELAGIAGKRSPKFPIVEQWIGMSFDEVIRMKPSREDWQVNRWPLIELHMTRRDCLKWMMERQYPEPPKSACIGCPYHNNDMWRDMRDNDPVSWADAIEMDKTIRSGFRGMKKELFLHRSCVPLDQVDLSTAEDRGQLNLFLNECEGMCGV
ncbi:hypothetical protein F9K91_02185 [Brucella tritici]|uniref:Phosphoadenosine phosphosulphate reductase domain-containing protein n=1 Tax=Brucella tritici TaxID=94626 RepID=A0A833FQ95_9HYPH|nr:hypothetical protein [Brucella tritici]KAB2666769.1 hypothetical protein F9K91_02185 [Brucella tritici]